MTAPDLPTLLELFRAAVETAPSRPAVVSGETTVGYAELDAQTDELAARLRADGVRAGARVVILLEGSAAFVRAYLATLKVGAVAVPADSGAPVASLTRIVQDCAPCAALLTGARASDLPALSAAAPRLRLAHVCDGPESGPLARGEVGAAQPAGHEEEALDGRTADDGVAAIIYTSGTTGPPKGVTLTRANMAAVERAGRELLGLRPGDVVGLVAPVFHLYGLRDIDSALSVGATLVLPRETHFPARVLAQLHAARATGISSVPSAVAILLERYREDLAACRDHLRYLALGTAPTPSSVIDGLRGALPHTRLLTTYGLTEASRVCWADRTAASASPPGTVGRPYTGVELKLEGEAEGIGRVLVRSGMVMKGYWNRPEATRSSLLGDGWARTPDTGWIDADGVLHLLGRVDDVINCGGQKVSPDEVEEVLARHPDVAAVAVLGVADAEGRLGQVVRAVVVRREGTTLSEAELLAHAAQALPRYKVPRSVEFVSEIPRTVLGKARRVLLRRGGTPAPADAAAS